MSDYKHHLLAGLITTAVAGAFLMIKGWLAFSPYNLGALLLISIFFSLLPDLDIGTSMIRKIVSVLIGAALIMAFISSQSLAGISLALVLIALQFLKHRGIMHSFLIGIVFSGLLYFYFGSWQFPAIALLNFLSHLALDA